MEAPIRPGWQVHWAWEVWIYYYYWSWHPAITDNFGNLMLLDARKTTSCLD